MPLHGATISCCCRRKPLKEVRLKLESRFAAGLLAIDASLEAKIIFRVLGLTESFFSMGVVLVVGGLYLQ